MPLARGRPARKTQTGIAVTGSGGCGSAHNNSALINRLDPRRLMINHHWPHRDPGAISMLAVVSIGHATSAAELDQGPRGCLGHMSSPDPPADECRASSVKPRERRSEKEVVYLRRRCCGLIFEAAVLDRRVPAMQGRRTAAPRLQEGTMYQAERNPKYDAYLLVCVDMSTFKSVRALPNRAMDRPRVSSVPSFDCVHSKEYDRIKHGRHVRAKAQQRNLLGSGHRHKHFFGIILGTLMITMP